MLCERSTSRQAKAWRTSAGTRISARRAACSACVEARQHGIRVVVGAGAGVGVGVKVRVGARETAPLQHLPRQAESPHCSLMYSLQLQSQLTSASLSPSCVSAALSDAASCVPRACAAGRATVHLAAHTLWLYGSLWLHLLWLHLPI